MNECLTLSIFRKNNFGSPTKIWKYVRFSKARGTPRVGRWSAFNIIDRFQFTLTLFQLKKIEVTGLSD